MNKIVLVSLFLFRVNLFVKLIHDCLINLFVATHSDHTGHTGFVDGPNHVAGETLRPESKT